MGLKAEPVTKIFLLGNVNVWLWKWSGKGLNVEEIILSRTDFFLNLQDLAKMGNEGTKVHQNTI